jgi:large subunit ribosomal protein L25
MSTAANVVEAKARTAGDKNAARRLRRTGSIPAVLYGAGSQPRAIAVDPKQITKILHSESGHNTIIDVSLDGEQAKAMIVDWQNEPIKGHLLHVDLKRIAMDKALQISVPIQLKGEAVGVRTQGGLLDFVLREIEIECLPVVAIKEEVAPTVEAAAEEAAAGPVEPEVIKKGKGETEGDEKEAKEGKKDAKESKKETKESKK